MSIKQLIKFGIPAALKLDINNLNKNEIQLTPDGEFSARDGRPATCKTWKMDTQIAKKVIAKLSKRKSKIVIDFEHKTIINKETGEQAHASGWFYGYNVVYRPGLGLFATKVEWTKDAARLIADKKYLYISPVLIYDARTGEVLDIYNAALTNDPALDGMNEVEVAATSNFFTQLTHYGDNTMPEEILALLRKILGLPETATEADILAALQQIEKNVADEEESTLSNLLNKQTQNIAKLTSQVTAQTTAIEALKAKKDGDGEVDPTKYVPIEAVTALTAEVTALKKGITGDKVTALVQDALTTGKLLPALKDWATDLGNKDITALSTYLEKAPKLDALTSTQTGGKPPENELGLTADELVVAKCSGLTPEEFAKAKKENK